MRKLRSIVAIALVINLCSSCESEQQLYSVNVCLAAEHHGIPAPGMVFYQAASKSFLGFRQNMAVHYDTMMDAGLTNRVCFENLSVGTHQFACVGYDPFLRDSILGALTLNLNVFRSNIDTIIQVSERH